MKKNKMMRIASVLLVAVLLTTCAISGTFAKYTTADSGSDTARVAKWGVTVEAKSFGMFKTDYEIDDDTATFSGAYSVSSASGDRDDLLAPGTKGSFADIAIKGTPEVAVKVSIVATVTLSDNWLDGEGKFYCPIVITVGTTKFNGLDYQSADAFAAAIKKELDDKSEQYAPNENLDAIYATDSLDLAWEWAFTGNTGSENTQTDVKDTFLGDAAANSGKDLSLSIGVVITVDQIN